MSHVRVASSTRIRRADQEIGIALGLKSAISCIFGSLLKDDCNIKDEIIDISKHIKEKLISDNHG